MEHAPALVRLPVGNGGREVVDEDVPCLEAGEEPLGRGLQEGVFEDERQELDDGELRAPLEAPEVIPHKRT